MITVRLDFETYSELDIGDVGPVVYANHSSTRILIMSWSATNDLLGTIDRGRYVPNEQDDTERLFSYLPGATVEAHNAMFEKCIWEFIGQGGLFWDVIAPDQWRCSAAKAAACALPRNLEDACDALELTVRKDMTGNRVMKKLTRPAKAKKVKPPTRDEFEQLFAYCDNDVDAETGLSEALPDLTDFELEVWRTDQRMNARGIPVDVPGALKAIRLADQWAELLNDELSAITGGTITRATQRERVLAWLQEYPRNVPVWDTQALTFDVLLASGMKEYPRDVRRVVEIVRSIGRSSISKYRILVETAHNGRLHDTQLYCGAGTGRWTAKRFQPQNLVRGTIKDMNAAWRSIHRDDLEMIQLLHGDPFEFLSHAIRGAVLAPDGYELYAADYNAVETRVLFWLADEQIGLDVFRNPKPKEDIYTVTACDIYGRYINKENSSEREVGKRAVLGLGFGMGYVKFLITCRNYGVKFTVAQILDIMSKDEVRETADYINRKDWKRCAAMGMTLEDLPELALMNFIVRRYRTRYKDTVAKMWTRVENAAKGAVTNPGVPFETNKLRYLYDGHRFLTCQLPSGRSIFYPFPTLNDDRLTHMGIDGKTKQWVIEDTYGGKLTENAVQAVARDLMAASAVRLDRGGRYELLMMVHDEVVSMSQNGNVKEYCDLIATVPDWAEGLPVKAEGWSGKRYKK